MKSQSHRAGPDEASSRRAALELEAGATPINTRRSEEAAMRYWTEWYCARYGKSTLPLPVPEKVIWQFILDHAVRRGRGGALRSEMPQEVERQLVERGAKRPGYLKSSTITQRVSMIGRINGPHLHDKPNPAGSQAIKTLLKNVRTYYARENISAPKPARKNANGPSSSKSRLTDRKPLSTEGLDALTGDLLNRLLDVLERDLDERTDAWTYRRAVRDRAMLLFAFMSGGRRRSEVASANMRQLRNRGKGEYVFVMGATKTTRGDEEKSKRERPVVGAAGEALDEWLKETAIRSGPIFRRIGRGGLIMDSGITPETVRNTVKRLASRAGLDGYFSAHSLRSGFVTEAARQRNTPLEITRLTGQSIQTAARYYREQDVVDAAAARLIDRPIKKTRAPNRG